MGKKSKRRLVKKSAVASPVRTATVPVPSPVPTPAPTSVPAPSAAPTPLTLPPALSANFHLLTPSQQSLALTLCSPPSSQSHLFTSPTFSSDPNALLTLLAQLERMNQSYPSGGLEGYIANAKVLLEKSKKGENPLLGWKPEVPMGESLDLGANQKDWEKFESMGTEEIGKCGFVLVAGGLGERLGYGGIKVCGYCLNHIS